MLFTKAVKACVLISMHCVASAFAVDQAAVEKWLQPFLDPKADPRNVLPPNTWIAFNLITRSSISDSDFAALQQRVGQKPDHPDRKALEIEQARRSPQGSVENKQVWFGSSSLWRVCTGEQSSFLDFGESGNDLWTLSPQRFVWTSPKVKPLEGHDIATAFTMELEGLDYLVTGGLREAARLGQTIQSISQEGNSWKVILKRADGSLARRLMVEWNDSANRGFISENMHLDQAGKEAGGWRIKGWSLRLPNLWMASAASSDGRWGGGKYEFQLVKVETVDEAKIKEMATPPQEGRPDPVRGELTFRTFIDGRSGSMEVSKRSAENMVRVDASSPSDRLRLFGWLIGGSVLIGLIALRAWLRKPG